MASKSSFAPRRLFREIKYEMGKALFFSAFLDAIILFFALNILLTLFSMAFFWAFIPSFVYLVWRVGTSFRKKSIRRLERGNPEINELLSTAIEYRSANSLMVQGLFQDLQRQLATVSAGVLLNPRVTGVKLVVIAILAFAPVIVAAYMPSLIQDNPLEGVDFSKYGMEAIFGEGTPEDGRLYGINLNDSDDIYGDANVLSLGDEKLNLDAKSGGGQVDFNTVTDVEDKTFLYADYPIEVEAEAAESATGGLYSDSEARLINDYSCRTRGTCEE